jgi:hypothetical protein
MDASELDSIMDACCERGMERKDGLFMGDCRTERLAKTADTILLECLENRMALTPCPHGNAHY